jgi:flagellar biosynthetic protein FlhB
MGSFVFIPDSTNEFIPGNPIKGEIHYKFSDALYKTLEPVVKEIDKLCILVISRNKLAVGLQYVYGGIAAPVLLFKTVNIKEAVTVCKKHGINIIYNKKAAEYIFNNTEINETIPPVMYEKVADIFVRLIRANNEFAAKINYKQ